ncbi:MAG: hypothetical protein E7181_04940 [Erysipelotrichaceae bacterium]|nr:hypothetical protein [Erysipelotrichaceae bacterium]
MIVSIVLLVLGALMSVVFIVSKVTNYSLKTIIFKTIASAFFVALAIYLAVTVEGHVPFKVLTTLGLFFGFLGDVLLGFKYITTGKAKKLWILAGMFAFAFGHISYIVGLFIEYYIPGQWWFILLPLSLALILSSLYMLISRKVGIEFGKLLPFGLFYLGCLSTMFSTSLFMAVAHGFSITTSIMFFVGAFFFVCSDTMLTGSYFKAGDRPKWYNGLYSVFYYLAQFIIAFSLFFLL